MSGLPSIREALCLELSSVHPWGLQVGPAAAFSMVVLYFRGRRSFHLYILLDLETEPPAASEDSAEDSAASGGASSSGAGSDITGKPLCGV